MNTATWTLSLLLLALPAAGDVLELRDGRTLEGTLRSATDEAIRFETAGSVHEVPLDHAAGLRFSPRTSGGAPARTPGALVSVPAGTLLRVRLEDTLDPRRSTEGDRFAARLETPIAVGAQAVAPARAVVYGVVTAASKTGPAFQRLRLELTSLQLQGQGQPVDVVTGTQQRVEATPAAGVPAKAAGGAVPERLDAGSLLEFRLLQPLELPALAR